MIRKHNSELAQKYPKENASKNASVEDESEGELYGLALILHGHNTEDTTADDLNSLSEQPNNKESREEEETSKSSKNEEDISHSKCFPSLNRRLVIYKSFYLFFFSAVGSLFPYLAVFYKQLWLSAHETGILMGIRPLIQLFGTPMWGVIADTYKKSKVIFIMSLVAWLVSNYSLSLVSPAFHLGVCKDNATMSIVQEILEELENRTIPVKNSTSALTHQKQKAPISVNAGKSGEEWFEIVGNSSKRTASDLHKPKSQNQVKPSHQDYQNVFGNVTNSFEDYSKLHRKSGGKNHSFSKSITFHRTDPFTESAHRLHRRNSSKLPLPDAIIALLNSLNNNFIIRDRILFVKTKRYFKVSKQGHSKPRRTTSNNKAVISISDILKLFHNSSDANLEEFISQVNRERLERVFDSLNMAGEYPWPLDTVANYDFTQASIDWQQQQAPHDPGHLFTILFVNTAIGTLIAAPAITLADTATLQNLGKCIWLNLLR